MFGFGFSEVMVILIVALIVVGPKKLPEVAKMIGRGYAQFKRAFEDIKDSVDLDLDLDDNRPYNYKKSKTTLNEIYREKWEKDIAKAENAEATSNDISDIESHKNNENKKNDNEDLINENKKEKEDKEDKDS